LRDPLLRLAAFKCYRICSACSHIKTRKLAMTIFMWTIIIFIGLTWFRCAALNPSGVMLSRLVSDTGSSRRLRTGSKSWYD
jgi:hypothetical protein